MAKQALPPKDQRKECVPITLVFWTLFPVEMVRTLSPFPLDLEPRFHRIRIRTGPKPAFKAKFESGGGVLVGVKMTPLVQFFPGCARGGETGLHTVKSSKGLTRPPVKPGSTWTKGVHLATFHKCDFGFRKIQLPCPRRSRGTGLRLPSTKLSEKSGLKKLSTQT